MVGSLYFNRHWDIPSLRGNGQIPFIKDTNYPHSTQEETSNPKSHIAINEIKFALINLTTNVKKKKPVYSGLIMSSPGWTGS